MEKNDDDSGEMPLLKRGGEGGTARGLGLPSKLRLSRAERDFVESAVEKYQRCHDLPALVQDLKFVLATPDKLKVLPAVRQMLIPGDRPTFDLLVLEEIPEYASMQRQREAPVPTPTPSSRSTPAPTHARRNGLGRQFVSSPNLHTEEATSELKVIKLRHQGGTLGFSIRGGAEHGLGIFVSQVDPGSAAEAAGLMAGDQIVEVNNVGLERVASSSAIHVLSSSSRLKMAVRRTGKVPEWKLAKEKVMWFDTALGKVVPQPPEEENYAISGLDTGGGARKVALNLASDADSLGLNVRGGREYGTGIYVSSIDRGGLAERNGISVGDQILEVNGKSFKDITHGQALEALRSSSHLVLTLRDVGCYPAFKEIYAEYTWSEEKSKSSKKPTRIQKFVDSSLTGHRPLVNGQPAVTVTTNHAHTQQPLAHHSKRYSSSSSELPVEAQVHMPRSNSLSNSEVLYSSNGLILPGPSRSTGHSDQDASDMEFDYSSFLEKTSATREPPSRRRQQEMSSGEITPRTEPIYAEVRKDRHRRPSNQSSQASSAEDRLNRLMSQSVPVLDGRHRKAQQHNVNNAEYIEHVYSSPANQHVARPHSSSSSLPLNEEDIVVITSPVDDGEQEREEWRRRRSGSSADKERLQQLQQQHQQQQEEEDDLEILQCQLQKLQSRQTHLGSIELSGLPDQGDGSHSDYSGPGEEREKEKEKGTWSTLKKKLTGTFRNGSFRKKKKQQSPAGTPGGTLSRRGLFEKNFGSGQLLGPQTVDKYNLMMLEEHARKVLSHDEFAAVMRHIKTYHDTKDLDRLVQMLLAILDTPEKMLLLRDVRGVIFPMHVNLFDNKVNSYEIAAYDKLSTKLHLPLQHSHDKAPKPSKRLMTTVLDEDGHFHIKTVDQYEKDVTIETEVLDTIAHQSSTPPFAPTPSPRHRLQNGGSQDRYTKAVYISNHKQNLGLKISGGREPVPGLPPTPIRIEEVYPGGAAADDGSIQPGMTILSVDDQNLVGVTHDQAVASLKRSFNNKASVAMKLVLMKSPDDDAYSMVNGFAPNT